MSAPEFVDAERARMLAEHRRRARELPAERYAAWQPAERFMREGRRLAAALMLRRAQAFPAPDTPCLEVGCGEGGWLSQLAAWGVREPCLHGIDLEPGRIGLARQAFPSADLREGGASELPWEDRSFGLIVTSTLFSSILDARVRQRAAAEIGRCLAPGGALLWYDFAVDNPRNPHVRGVDRRELRELFPFPGQVRRVTLAPPLARALAPRSWALATLLEAIPWLRTHLLAVLIKP